MNRNGLLLVLALSATGFACDNDPGEGKEAAEVSTPSAEALSAPPAEVEGTAYTFSHDGSTIGFVGAKVTGKHEGSFKQFSGTVDLVDNDPTKSSVMVDVAAGSLEADDPKLTNHLKSEDFFNAEKFSRVSFRSSNIAKEAANYKITGNLTMHGQTKTITFPASIEVSEASVDVKSEFVINRKDFGITYPGMPDDLIKDEVLVKLDVHATPGQ